MHRRGQAGVSARKMRRLNINIKGSQSAAFNVNI